ncbi:unnamed protein product [Gadus morhua 'NCC']
MSTPGRKRREDIWENFIFDVKDNKTQCKKCSARITGKNTTNLKRHLQSNHPEIHTQVSIFHNIQLTRPYPFYYTAY